VKVTSFMVGILRGTKLRSTLEVVFQITEKRAFFR
jgi:hypothetical protein